MKKFFAVAVIILVCFPFVSKATQTRDDQIQIRFLDVNGAVENVLYPFDSAYRGSGSIVSGDLGDDNVSEILLGSGPGMSPEVFIYRQDGSFIDSFLAYSESFTGGVNVAVGDVDGDGVGEIVTGAMYGGGPHIRVFDGWGNLEQQFFAYDENFRGGVNVAVGDLDNNGTDEIITGAGVTGGPHVKVFNNVGSLINELFVSDAYDGTGATVATLDVNGDGDDELITGRAGYSDTRVQLFDWNENHLSYVLAIDAFENNNFGLNVFGGDVDGDGMDEIGVATKGGEAKIAFYEMTGRKTLELEPFATMVGSSVTVINESDPQIIALGFEQQNVDQAGQYILVDTDRQTLYAYENGVLKNAFLVSTGVSSYPSPIGMFSVLNKILWKDYTWYFGEGDARNYDLSGVKYNLNFKPMYYIHSAYWHNNFGNKMSHGCINTAYDDAEWIYNWAEIGAVVEVR